ncbi:MAG: site-specific DNA-methyltransferase, partial [Patescibacteria group bacterium]|nr:site-specific DNA-methyltransferase [Patescibacteria group bacterium]
VVKELRRILKDDGHLFVFSNCDSYPVFYEPTYNHFDKLKSLVWDKGKVGLGKVFRNQHELIIWARNEGYRFNNDHQLRADVLTFSATPPSKRNHPVEKPVNMLQELIRPTTFEGDIVFDPFAGSGTTLEAARLLNRKAIGIEIAPDYVEIIKKRERQEVLL